MGCEREAGAPGPLPRCGEREAGARWSLVYATVIVLTALGGPSPRELRPMTLNS